MIWLFIILGLMILGCMVMAVKDEKKYGYSKRRMRNRKKKSPLRRMKTLIDDDHFTDYYYW